MNISEKYIGERSKTSLFKYQEWCRIETSKYNDKYIGNGWYSLILMYINPPNNNELKDDEEFQLMIKNSTKARKRLYEIITIEDMLDINTGNFNKLNNEIENKLPNFPINVKNFVKDLWTFPKNQNDYEPFKKTGIIISKQFKINEKDFKFDKIDNGYYVIHKNEKTIVDILWNNKDKWYEELIKNNQEYGFEKLEKPLFNSHITIINNNIGEKHKNKQFKINELIEKYNKLDFDINLNEILHVFDERFAPYETVVVIEIFSNIINKFLKEFNELTNENIKISQHITIAVRFRK